MVRIPELQDAPTNYNESGTYDPSMEKSLDRLLLSNQIRELADFPIPVTVRHLAYTSWLLSGIAGLVDRLVRYLSKRPISRWNRSLPLIMVDALVLLLVRFVINKGMFWRHLKNTLSAIIHNGLEPAARYHHAPEPEITSYVSSDEGEQLFIRFCLWLRLNRRFGLCIRYLRQRLDSGLPSIETRAWLSFFLREIKDERAAQVILPAAKDSETEKSNGRVGKDWDQPLKRDEIAAGLGYGIIVSTMFDSPVFRASLHSLLNSDFQGQVIVVEDGNQPTAACQSFCESLPVTYLKNPEWVGVNGLANRAIEQLGKSAAVIIFAHNDVLWPDHWFSGFDAAWREIYPEGKVGTLNLGCLEFSRNTEPVLSELFVRNQYQDLSWTLQAMRKSRTLMGRVDDLRPKGKRSGDVFGINADWTAEGNKLRTTLTAGFSFPSQVWRDLGGFDPAMGNDLFSEINYHCLQNKKWILSFNNEPLIHMVGSDTNLLRDIGKIAKFSEVNSHREQTFQKNNGWHPAHVGAIFWGESVVVHYDQILEAVNSHQFSAVDFVFDDFFERLQRTTLSTCEIAWCPARRDCLYK